MAAKGYTYVPIRPDDEVGLRMDAHLVDPTWPARHADEYPRGFGIVLFRKSVDEYLSFTKDVAAGPKRLTNEEFHESVALHGDENTPGCVREARAKIGSWELDTFRSEVETVMDSSVAALRDDKRFQSLDAEFAACAQKLESPLKSMFDVYQQLGEANIALLDQAAAEGKLASEAGIGAVLAESKGMDEVAARSMLECLSPIRDQVVQIFDEYFQ